MKRSMANIFVIVGGSNSGKDELIRAVYDLGGLHAQIVPKFTSRAKREDDGMEIQCNYDFELECESGQFLVKSRDNNNVNHCDIVYYKNDNYYGIDSHEIWTGLREQKFQVIVASEVEAINKLREKFGKLVILIYVYGIEESKPPEEFQLFLSYFNEFDHVLIAERRKEDLYDQLFRLFRAYE